MKLALEPPITRRRLIPYAGGQRNPASANVPPALGLCRHPQLSINLTADPDVSREVALLPSLRLLFEYKFHHIQWPVAPESNSESSDKAHKARDIQTFRHFVTDNTRM